MNEYDKLDGIIKYEGIQGRFNFFCNLIKKRPDEIINNVEYISWINKMVVNFKKENNLNRYVCVGVMPEFDMFIIKNGSKYI